MKLFMLQIHNSESNERDEIYIFTKFSNLCKEFEKQFKHLKMVCDEMISEDYPNIDNDDCVCGSFRFGCADGSITKGVAYDYHVLDEN